MEKENQKIKKNEFTQTATQAPNNISDATKLICVDCRYNFSLKKTSRIPMTCPYCGGNRIMRNELNAEKLVDEISQRIDTYKQNSYRNLNTWRNINH